VSSDAPEMSERILQEAGAISIELVLNRLQDFRTLGLAFATTSSTFGK